MTAEGMPFGESISASPAANDQTPPPGTPALANAGPAEIAAAPFSEADTAESPDPAQIAVNAAPETEVVANPDLAATANPAPEVETAANADPENAKIMDRFPEAPTPSAPYQVQPGDTLEAVAMALAVPLAALIQANHIQDPNLILAGTELIIPVMPAAAATENAGPDGEPQQPPTATMPGNSLPLQDLQATASRPIDAVTLLTQLQASQPHPAATENPYLARLLEEIEAAQTAHQSRPATQSPIPETTVRAASTPTRAASRRVRRSTPRVTTARAAAGKRAPAASGTWNNRRVEASAPIPFGPGAYPELSAEFKGFVWPSPGVLTSGFGWRWGRMHRGVDIAAPSGTPVVAAAPGVVEFAGWNDGGYGNMVDIRHPDGSLTRYAHNSRLLVRAGQTVLQGQLVSEVGSTGYSTGPHLHFEIHQPTGGAVNPIALLPEEPKL
jgi:murein DD-endopeptidase MepM/ murein hydrolase activator NlpD